MMVFESGIETLSFTPPQPLSFTQQYVLIEGLCVSLVALFSSFSPTKWLCHSNLCNMRPNFIFGSNTPLLLS